MLVGYARVSTQDQNCEMQIEQLQRAGCLHIWSEKTSSVGRRPELYKAINSLSQGDVLVVYKIDRLARSLKDLLQIMERLKLRKAGFRSLTEPINTETPAGIMMMQMLGAVAEFERSLIRERSIAGQLNARNQGKHCGRNPEFTHEQLDEVLRLRANGHTYNQIQTQTGVGFSQQKRIYSGRIVSFGAKEKARQLGLF